MKPINKSINTDVIDELCEKFDIFDKHSTLANYPSVVKALQDKKIVVLSDYHAPSICKDDAAMLRAIKRVGADSLIVIKGGKRVKIRYREKECISINGGPEIIIKKTKYVPLPYE